MTYALIALILTVAGMAFLLYRQSRDFPKELADALLEQESQNRKERAELLTRIQHPEVVPMPQGRRAAAAQPRDPDQMAQVGAVMPPPKPQQNGDKSDG